MHTGPKKNLLDLIKNQGQLTVDQLVEKVNLAKTTVREHMSQLENEGYIVRNYISSGRGRPSLCFKLTKKGNSLYPSYEPEMIKEFIRYLQTEGEHRILENFFEKFWNKRYKKLQLEIEENNAESEEEKLRLLKKMLDEEGFMPECEKRKESGEIIIKECNCPFSEIIKVTKLPCKLEQEFYQKVFERPVKRKTYIAEGDFACTYSVG